MTTQQRVSLRQRRVWPTTASERPLYPAGVPIKFSADGVVQRYPGNTTVCHIPVDSPLQPSLRLIYETLGSHPTFSRMIRLVPQESWHMTVFDGPKDLEKQPLDVSTREFSQSLRQFGLGLEEEGLAPPYRMRVRSFDPAVVGVGLEIEGATAEEEQRIRRLRDRLANTLGFRAPNHLTYQFHVTIAYWLRHVDGADRTELNGVFSELLPAVKMEFELRAVEFCVFENMDSYPRLFYLGDME
ncbi:RNA ligase/cyclic nucleotide phosphodiesterase [Dactylonectria macrodidyma]|uniref:RNA ligase/cyclic nucleotide phosphodiesterase n=1 Tax=Dactylonectria macrodidyma TaxID=307937 RepID=A0A9P9F8B6_9HYPO|nr:RNA ligase/cyclic nucleotide phosphodiesterase [Dactylonectria macrodidyma]